MPNRVVDVDSWTRSACYPQSTFYPMSDGPSTRYRRITLTCFRTCSTRWSRSQAPLYLYALRTIADRAEGTFVHLRYFLGGNRPSQTTRLTLFLDRIHGRRLDAKHIKGSIPRLAQRRLASSFHSLLPILYVIRLAPISRYSKGSGVSPSSCG